MDINSSIDSNAVALDSRNFGALPTRLCKDWMIRFASIKKKNLPHPTKAIIEIINSCNLDCPMCRVGQYGVNFKRIMPLETFSSVISQIKGLSIVRLNGLGESTLVPNFNEYLDYLFNKKLYVELITNGTGKFEIYKKILNNSGSVIISWDAAEKDIFEKLRRPTIWEVFVKKIQDLRCSVSKDNGERISLLFTIQKQNVGQLEKLIKKCAEWNIRNVIVNAIKDDEERWTDEDVLVMENDCRLAYALAKESDVRIFLPSQIFGKKIRVDGTYTTNSEKCQMPWKEVVVRWNGDIQACNMFNPYVYGNIYLNSFNDIWNNLFANLFRTMINTDKKHPYCVNCVYFEEAYKK